MITGNNIRYLRTKLGYSQEYLANLLGYKSYTTVTKWESGISEPTLKTAHELAAIFQVSVNDLCSTDLSSKVDNNFFEYEKYGIKPVEYKKLPHLGKIACGKPIFVSEDSEEYVYADTSSKADFTLKAQGDSMSGANINDGNIVFIKKQSSVDNGQIAAVIIEDEALLKRVYLSSNKILLLSENPKYEPIEYIGEEMNNIHIMGRVIACQFAVI